MVACYIWCPSRLNTGADYVPYLRKRHTSHLPPSYLLTIPKSIERKKKVEDSIALQSDLTTLDLWADRWQVKFNPSKCEVMRITHNKNKNTTRYQVSGTELRNVTSYKDLGVIMASDLTWTINMFIKQTRFLAYLNAQ